MKKRLTRVEKLLFAAPLLFLIMAGVASQWKKNAPLSIDLPKPVQASKMEFSPDGKQLLVELQDTNTLLHSCRIYDVKTRSVICELATPPRLAAMILSTKTNSIYYGSMAWSSDGKRIVASTTKNIAIWDAKTGAVQFDYRYTSPRNRWHNGIIHFSADSKTLVGEGVPPARYALATGKPLNKPDAGIYQEWRAISNETLGLVAISDAGTRTVKVIDSKSKRVMWQPKISHFADFAWQGEILLVKDDAFDGTSTKPLQNRIWLWNGKTRQLLPSPPLPIDTGVGYYGFNPDGRTLSYTKLEKTPPPHDTGLYKVELVTWDYRANRELWSIQPAGSMENLNWSPDGKWLTGINDIMSLEVTLYVYDQNGKLRFSRQSVGHSICWSDDGKQLATVKSGFVNGLPALSKSIEIERFED